MNDSKNHKDIFSHFYTFYYDITKLATHKEDPVVFTKIDNIDIQKVANDSLINACILYANPTANHDYLNLNKLPSEKYEKVYLDFENAFKIDKAKLKLNHEKLEVTKTIMEEEFEIICGIGRDTLFEAKPHSRGRKPGMPARKDLAKILGYNSKRKEFDEEEKEEVLCELNFSVPNYCNDTGTSESIAKVDSRKRTRKPKEKFNNLDITDEQKLSAISYYNNILDLRNKQYKLIREWGLLD
jgi:hypothetical protein